MTITFDFPQHIVISGAGVSGLAVASLFARQGSEVTIVERAPALRAGGHAVDFRGQAVEVLRRMLLLDGVLEAATGNVDTWYVDASGRRRATLPREIMGGEIEITRGDLIRILADAARAAGATIRFGASLASVDAATVTLESGDVLRADLVVAADGLHSRVRGLAFGHRDGYLTRLGYTAAVFTTDNFLQLDHAGRFYSTPGRTVGVSVDRDPAEARVAMYFADNSQMRPRSLEARRSELRERFEGAGWAVPEILARLDRVCDVDDLYYDQMAQVHVDRYSEGRIVLLGDAGYAASPLSGMGTSLAMIGAYMLAHEIAIGEDLRSGLAAYERRMRPLVTACQKLAEGAGQFFIPASRAMIAMRDFTYRAMPYLPWRGMFAEIPRKAANSIVLPGVLEVSLRDEGREWS